MKTQQIISENNANLLRKLIPFGYKKFTTSKVYDIAFNKPCELPSFKIDKLV